MREKFWAVYLILQSYGSIPPPPNYNVTLNIQPIIQAFYNMAGMLITALALSTAAIALPLLRINRKLSDLNASVGGSLITEILRERIQSARVKLDSERQSHA